VPGEKHGILVWLRTAFIHELPLGALPNVSSLSLFTAFMAPDESRGDNNDENQEWLAWIKKQAKQKMAER
jgi:hypothetical protein